MDSKRDHIPECKEKRNASRYEKKMKQRISDTSNFNGLQYTAGRTCTIPVFVQIETAPFNLGKKKLYEGIPGNLFAFTCKTSWDNGYQGFVSFTSKTKLIEHYEKTLGAAHVGGHKMVIFPREAHNLIRKYFSN